MHTIILRLITLIHVIFVLFLVLTPFIGTNYLLLLEAIFIPFMMLHWIFNDNTCVLTLIESHVRKSIYGDKYKPDDCITRKLINPVYDFKKDNKSFSKTIYGVTTILWLITLAHIYYRWHSGKISNYTDFFIS